MLLGNRIRRIRETYNLTQSEIAYRCQISPSAYGQIERKANKASFETLQKIADALGVSVAFLVDINTEILIEEKNKL